MRTLHQHFRRISVLLLLTPACAAQGFIVVDSPNAQPGGQFGISMEAVGDLDGDGKPDLGIGAHNETVGAETFAGRVYLVSGATGQLIRTLQAPTPGHADRFGRRVTPLGDIDGDRVPDVGVADFNARVYLISGASGAVIRIQNCLGVSAGAIAGLGDVNGDGVPDIAISGRPSPPPPAPQVCIYSGANGALIRRFGTPIPDNTVNPVFGEELAGIDDVDEDDVPDYMVDVPRGNARALVFSGATGAHLTTLGRANTSCGGSMVAGIPDIDGDSVPDLAQGGACTSVYLHSGATGARLDTLDVAGHTLATVGDVDGGGIPDLLVANLLFSSETRNQLFAYHSPYPWQFGGFGLSVASLGDADGDGWADVAIAAPYEGAGRVYIFLGMPTGVVEGPTAEQLMVTLSPNPAEHSVVVRIALPSAATVRVRVLDALGRVVIDTAPSMMQAGARRVPLETTGLAPGVYAVSIQAGDTATTHLLMVK